MCAPRGPGHFLLNLLRAPRPLHVTISYPFLCIVYRDVLIPRSSSTDSILPNQDQAPGVAADGPWYLVFAVRAMSVSDAPLTGSGCHIRSHSDRVCKAVKIKSSALGNPTRSIQDHDGYIHSSGVDVDACITRKIILCPSARSMSSIPWLCLDPRTR